MMKIYTENDDMSKSRAIMTRIAATLGCSIEVFQTSNVDALPDTLELLDLWLSIRNVQDRAKMLSYARTIASHDTTIRKAD